MTVQHRVSLSYSELVSGGQRYQARTQVIKDDLQTQWMQCETWLPGLLGHQYFFDNVTEAARCILN